MTVVALFYKAYIFEYVGGYLTVEILGICALYGLQNLRLFMGSKGNKTETSHITIYFALISAITIAANIYYLQYQTYVLVLDVVLGAISLGAAGFEVMFACWTAIEFKSLENSR